MQPTYIPWLGYFNLIKNSDEFVFYITTQLAKRSWQTRNRILSSNGNTMLSIPIKKTAQREKIVIKDAKVENSFNWQKKHLSSIKHSYAKTPFFDHIFPIINNSLSNKNNFLIDYTIPIILSFVNQLDIKTDIILSNEIPYHGKKDEALVSICKERKARDYLSVTGASDYILSGENLFSKSDIKLKWNQYNHPIYTQLNLPFQSHLSIIDALFFLGFEGVKNII